MNRSSALDFAGLAVNEHARQWICGCAVSLTPFLFVAPPSCGKTMLAARCPGLLPAPTGIERGQIIAAAGAARLWPADGDADDVGRPFRAPHYTVSAAGLAGEAKLATCGVLFLDEIDRFRRKALVALYATLADTRPEFRPWLILAVNEGAEIGRENLHALGLAGPRDLLVRVILRRGEPSAPWPSTAAMLAEVESVRAIEPGWQLRRGCP